MQNNNQSLKVCQYTDAHVHFGTRGDFDADLAVRLLMEDMDKNRIEKIFLFPIGSTPERNNQMLAAIRGYEDRLLPFVWLSPKNKESLDYFRDLLKSGEIRGLKLHPYSDGYRIDDFSLMDSWMELAESQHCHIIVHCTAGDRNCSPLQLEKLAVRYPDTTFQMAHMGAIWKCSEAIEVVKRNNNIYGDTSIISYSAMKRAGQNIPRRLLLGTDYPFYRFEMEHLKLELAVEDEEQLRNISRENFMDLCSRLQS